MTSIETGPSWVERLNPRHWTLVWKLVIVGLVPALLALTLGALRISDQAGTASDLAHSGDLLGVHAQVAAAGDALREERDQATLYVASNRTGDRNPLTKAAAHSDDVIAAMRNGIQAEGSYDQPTTVAIAQANGVIEGLRALRQDVTDTPSVALPSIRDRYSRVIEGTDVLDRAILRAVRVPDTGGQIDALTALQNVESQLSVQHTVLGDAIRAGKLQDGDANAANNADVQIFAQYRAYQVALTPDQLQRYGSFLDDPSNADRQRLAIAILASAGRTGLGGVTVADWDGAYNSAKTVADRSAGLLAQDLSAQSNAAAQQAGNLAGINSVVLMLGLLIGITIAVLVARSLVRSLRLLRSAALDVAERRLPQAVESMRAGETPDVMVDPVPIRTRDEVGQVARAFDAVHGQAVRLAADQAALQANVSSMFVNLSRRSQALVERQLQLIEALESNEQDADQLSSLFQLDHLATRMRRNSENLLVLAGTDLAKRNMAPVPIVDVLRAAVSEVEQYQRIVVQAPPAASIAGRAGADLVHLLAELLDNATNFSPPESQVVMSATRTSDGAMVIEISDRGVGMADHELSDANQRLGGPSSVDVSASRRMGLFVVGRLAARHGIVVHLSSAAAGPGTGLTASVTVPVFLIPIGGPAETARPGGVPMAAAVPTQSRQSGETRTQRSELNGSRPPSTLSSLVAGTDGPAASAPPLSHDTSVGGGGQSTLSGGRPPVNGSSGNGLPTRKPGSSLRPEGPPPTDAPPGGFFGDSHGGEGSRAPAEQARLDQEAAARRDRMAGTGSAPADRPSTSAPSGEWSAPGDERSPRTGDGPTEGAGPRLTKNAGDPAPAEDGRAGGPRAFTGGPGTGGPGTSGPGIGGPGTGGQGPASGAPTGAQTGGYPPTAFRGRPDGPQANPASGQPPLSRPGQQTGETRRPLPSSGGPTWNGGGLRATGASSTPTPPGADRSPDADAPSGTEDNEPNAGPSHTGQFRTDQQRRGPQSGQPGSPSDAPPSSQPSGGQQSGAYPYAVPPSGQPYGTQQSNPTAFGRPYPFAAPPNGPQQNGPQQNGPNGPLPYRGQPNGSVSGTGAFPDSPPRSGPVAMPPGSTRAPKADDQAPPSGPAPLPAMAPPPADRPVDELFAPRVPSLDAEGAPPGRDLESSAFDLGETTPIFEEIASAWFRSNRPVPVSWESDTGPHPTTPAAQPEHADVEGVAAQTTSAQTTSAQEASAQEASAPTPTEGLPTTPEAPRQAVPARADDTPTVGGTPADTWQGRPAERPVDTDADAGSDAAPSATPTPIVPAARPAPEDPYRQQRLVPQPSMSQPSMSQPSMSQQAMSQQAMPETAADFATAADEGWLAASAATDRADELTAAGLPKRRPRARLVPGSAGSAVLAPAVTSPRSAETIRGRLASYQQGVRQGRETRLRGFGSADTPATPAAADADHDEESS